MEDQLERVTEELDQDPVLDDGLSPRMPFPTSYRLTRDQEDELIDHAFKRLEDLESETGRNQVADGDGWMHTTPDTNMREQQGLHRTERTFMGKRRLYDLVYDNEVEHRAHILGGVFAKSNFAVPISRRIARQMTARAANYFFATDPWFSCYPVGAMDRELADKSDRYLRWKLDAAGVKRTEEQAIERAFALGEAVVKTTWKLQLQPYRTMATVLVDEQGADILAADGDFILESDLWIEEVVVDEMSGEEVRSGMMVLKRDGKTPKPEVLLWTTKLVSRRLTLYRGPEAKVLHYLDFLCPLDAPSVYDADCVAHLYDMPVMELADQWRKSLEDGSTPQENFEATRKAVALIRELSTSSSEPKSGQNSDDEDLGQSTTMNRGERSGATAQIVEFHLRYDADGDGMMEEIMLLVDRRTKTPIFYDYMANITPDGQRPFSVVRVNEKLNRWYGIGAIEMFETSQNVVDLLVNRWNLANSQAGRVDFWSPHNTVEGRANTSLALNWGGTYTPLPGKTSKDCLESIYLENIKDDELQRLAEFFMQLMMVESGIQNANDAQVTGLDSAKLATGIRNIEKSGQELFSLYLGHLEPGILSVLKKCSRLVWTNLDPNEVYIYFEDGEEGGEGSGDMRRIDPSEIHGLELDVRVLLTRYRGEQILESSIRAVEIVERFYQLPFMVQVRTYQLYRDMLKALQVANARDIIEPVELPPMGAPGNMPPAKETSTAASNRPRIAGQNY
jgi:hypothetical protein